MSQPHGDENTLWSTIPPRQTPGLDEATLPPAKAEASEPQPSHGNHDHQLPQSFGRYRVVSLLGQGGFGAVYEAVDDQLRRNVAIKVTFGSMIDPSLRQSFLTEARVVAGLDHPGIVPVLDVGETEEGNFFIVSKLVDGSDLSSRMKRDRPDRILALRIVEQIADALNYAHATGLVHRDVKPANILLDRQDRPYLTDFGIALREVEKRREGDSAGTPAYMSPEQARGEGHRIDNRSDIFSLGVVLYELLTGRRPFRSDNQFDLMLLVATEEVRSPRLFDDTISQDLERICLKALARRASDRFTVARDFAEDIRWFLTNHTLAPGQRPDLSSAPAAATPQTPLTPNSAQLVARVTDSQRTGPTQIVPKGLRSFDAADSSFFLELLPGPFDRDGLPEGLRFWKMKIEETAPDKTFSVGLVYGPSGCGKSSLMKAGLLPRLSPGIIPVYIEATPDDTELRLMRAVRKAIPDAEGDSLKDVLSCIRRRRLVPRGGKLLLVLDQFEQWLFTQQNYAKSSLTEALLQCDGATIQAIVMVRDDFWISVSRFLRELDIPILERENSAMVDLFDLEHAARVLGLFGKAYGKLPYSSKDWNQDQNEFIRQAVNGLSQDHKVISVRIAVLADMMKSRDWTTSALREVGGIEGVGVTFLEEMFGNRHAPIQHRRHQEAVRGLLSALLPTVGTDIKGSMRSADALQKAAGYDRKPREFQELLGILDKNLRLITPVDDVRSEDEDHSVKTEHSEQSQSYQLAHDYMVPSLREWLTQKDRQTFRGRARLAMLEHAGRWQAFGRKNSDLPGFFSLATMLFATTSAEVDTRAAEMLHVACLKKLKRRLSGTLFVIWPLLQIGLIVLVLLLVYLTRHAAAEGNLVGESLVRLAGPLSLASIVSLLMAIVFIRQVVLYSLWWPWRHNWSLSLRPAMLALVLGTLMTLPTVIFLHSSSTLPAIGAVAEQHIAEQLKAGQENVALTHLSRAIDEFPMPGMYVQRARIRLAQKDYDAVIADSTLALEAGTKETSKGSVSVGINYLKRFTNSAFNAEEAYFLRAEALRSLGRVDAATDDLLQVLINDSDTESSFFGPTAVTLWRVSPHLFWLQTDQKRIAAGLGQTAVQDADPSVRRDALRILGQMGYYAAEQAESVRQGLKDVSPDVQLAAVGALSVIDWQPKEALPVLTAAIRSPEEHIRKSANQLARSLGSDALPLLSVCIEEMQQHPDRDWGNNPSLVESLSRASGARAIPELLSTLSKISNSLSLSQLGALQMIAEIGLQNEADVATMATLMERSELNGYNVEFYRGVIVSSFGSSGEHGIGPLTHLLSHPSEDIRISSAKMLGGVQGTLGFRGISAIPELTNLLASPSVKVRVAAATALWNLEQPAQLILPALLDGLRYDDAGVRLESAQLLAQFGPEAAEAIPHLVEAMMNSAPDLQLSAAQGLWRIQRKPEEVIPVLKKLLQDKLSDDSTQYSACDLLATIGRQSDPMLVTPTLLEFLAESDVPTSCLPQFGDIVVGPLIDSLKQTDNPRLRERAANTLGQIGPAADEAVPHLIVALQDDDPKVRQAVVSALGRFGQTALAEIRSSAKDTDAQVRLAAASALWEITRDATAVLPVLIESLNASDVSERQSAAAALHNLGIAARPALRALQAAARDVDSAVRLSAAGALWSLKTSPDIQMEMLIRNFLDTLRLNPYGWERFLWSELGESAAPYLPLLLRSFTEPPRPNQYYYYATINPSESGIPEVVSSAGPATLPALLQVAKHPKPELRQLVALSLATLEDEARDAIPVLKDLLKDEEPAVRVASAHALWKIEHQPESLIPVLVDCLKIDKVAVRAMATLQDMAGAAQPAVSSLTPLLEHSDRSLRIAAGRSLLKIGEPVDRILPTMIRELENPRSPSHYDVIAIVTEIGPAAKNVLPTLTEFLKREDLSMRLSVVPAIAKISQRVDDVLPILQEGLKNPRASLRAETATSCGSLGAAATPVIPLLIEILADPDVSVRLSAAGALGAIGSESRPAVPALISLLDDKDLSVRTTAITALGAIGSESRSAVPALISLLDDKDLNVRTTAMSALGSIGNASGTAVPKLIAMLRTSQGSERDSVISALAGIGAEATSAKGELYSVLSTDQGSARASTAWALLKIDPTAADAATVLTEMLRSPDHAARTQAASCLKDLEKTVAVALPALKDAAKDSSWDIRHSAKLSIDTKSP